MVEWFKDKTRLPSTFYQSGNSYISDLQLTAVTVSQAGAFECRTTVVPTPYKGYRVKTGMLFVKGNWTMLDIFQGDSDQMNSFIVKLTDIVKLMKNFVIKVIMETNILFFIKLILLANYL